MLKINQKKIHLLTAFFFMAMGGNAVAQALPNPYRTVDNWAKLPADRTMGMSAWAASSSSRALADLSRS